MVEFTIYNNTGEYLSHDQMIHWLTEFKNSQSCQIPEWQSEKFTD